MHLSMPVGYLVALTIGPQTIMPSAWPPWARDIDKGQADAQFTNPDEMKNIIQMVMRLYKEALLQF